MSGHKLGKPAAGTDSFSVSKACLRGCGCACLTGVAEELRQTQIREDELRAENTAMDRRITRLKARLARYARG
jgi:hypothetical protein